MAASSRGKDLVAAFEFALRRLSPGSVPAHWNSWEGVEVSLTLDPVRKTSQFFTIAAKNEQMMPPDGHTNKSSHISLTLD